MKGITISLTREEYIELARLVTTGTFVTHSQDDYAYRRFTNELIAKICKHGFKDMPETGAFMKEGVDTLFNLPVPEFGISNNLHQECEELNSNHVERQGTEYFVNWLAMRDFNEKYGEMDDHDILNNPDYFGFMMDRQTEYCQEFLFNGVMNLRLVK